MLLKTEAGRIGWILLVEEFSCAISTTQTEKMINPLSNWEKHSSISSLSEKLVKPDIFLWECFSVPPQWGSGPPPLDDLPADLGSDAPEEEAPAYTLLLKRPLPPYLREDTRIIHINWDWLLNHIIFSQWNANKKNFLPTIQFCWTKISSFVSIDLFSCAF